MQMKLKLTVVATLAMVASLASAQDAVVKIGHVAPMSGSQAHYGKDNENGARMAVEDLNGQNIVIGGKKIKFELWPKMTPPIQNRERLQPKSCAIPKFRVWSAI